VAQFGWFVVGSLTDGFACLPPSHFGFKGPLEHLGTCLGLARTIYIRFVYDIFGREITKYTVIYGAYIRFWPALDMFRT